MLRSNKSNRYLARALGLPFVDLAEHPISCGILRKIPAEVCCRFRCVPVVFNKHRVVLAVDDPFNAAYLSASPELLGPPYNHKLEFAVTTSHALDLSLHRRVTLVKD